MLPEVERHEPAPPSDRRLRGSIRLPILAGLCALVAVLPDVLKPPPYGWDQSYALQAATRLAHGQGLTYSRAAFPDYVPDDLASPRYAYYARYAPGYPVLIAALLQQGLALPKAVILVKVAAYVLGWIAGGLIAARVFRRYTLLLWYVLLAIPFLRPVPLRDATDVLLWAVVAWWALALMGLVARLQRRGGALQVIGLALAVGALCFVGVAFRWAGVFLAPATGLALLLSTHRAHRLWLAVVAILVCLDAAVLPALAMKQYVETQPNAGANYITEAKPGWSTAGLQTSEPWLGLLARPFGAAPLAERRDLPELRTVTLAATIAVLAALLVAVGRAFRPSAAPASSAATFSLIAALGYGCMAASLLGLSAYLPPPRNFFFADDWRYFTVMSLPIVLFVALSVARLEAARPQLAGLVASAVITAALIAPGLCALSTLRPAVVAWQAAPGTPWVVPKSEQRVAVEREIAARHAERVVVFTHRPTDFIAEDEVVAYYPSCVRSVEALRAALSLTVLVVLPQGGDPKRPADDGERLAGLAIIHRFDLGLVAAGAGFEVYAGEVAVGSGQGEAATPAAGG